MIFTEEEFQNYCPAPEVYLAQYAQMMFDRLNITLNETQYNRWYLVSQTCDGIFQQEIAYIYRIVSPSIADTMYPCMDRLYFMSLWILYGDPDSNTSIPWANEEIVDTLLDATGCNQYNLADTRYIIHLYSTY